MCCLFGLLDYGHSLTAAQKNHILAVLSTVCEARGTDATGIAYNTDNGLQIYKRPLPAHHLRLRIPKDTNYVMGHTRMTTQGCEIIIRSVAVQVGFLSLWPTTAFSTMTMNFGGRGNFLPQKSKPTAM